MKDAPADWEAHWLDLMAPWEPSLAEVRCILHQLIEAYASAGRCYHTLDHVRAMLDMLAAYRSSIADYAMVRLATWFHDAVYDARRDDNEVQSVRFARRTLAGLGVPGPVVERVAALVASTRQHVPAEGDRDGALFLDADLAILGADEAVFRAYGQAIRREYAWLPERAYWAARKQVLQAFLDRDRIYWTDDVAERRESQARWNLKAEIESLNKELGFHVHSTG